MTAQPEALRLADALDAWDGTLMMPAGWRQRASAELRRLHEAHDWQYKMAGERLRRIENLEAQRDALLEALRAMRVKYGQYACRVCDLADAAIKKAEEA